MGVWSKILALSVGGVLGVNARYWLGVWISRWSGPHFPWATFSINVSGAFVIGFLGLIMARWSPHSYARLLLITGFLGGYTTFSTFAQESTTLWERGEIRTALCYMLGSVIGGFVAVLLGAAFGRGLTVVARTWPPWIKQAIATDQSGTTPGSAGHGPPPPELP